MASTAQLDTRSPPDRVGFYGMDLYSLHSSMGDVLQYLGTADPGAAKLVRERCACFDQYGSDSQVYGLMAGLGTSPGCEREVIATLMELRRHAWSSAAHAQAPQTYPAGL